MYPHMSAQRVFVRWFDKHSQITVSGCHIIFVILHDKLTWQETRIYYNIRTFQWPFFAWPTQTILFAFSQRLSVEIETPNVFEKAALVILGFTWTIPNNFWGPFWYPWSCCVPFWGSSFFFWGSFWGSSATFWVLWESFWIVLSVFWVVPWPVWGLPGSMRPPYSSSWLLHLVHCLLWRGSTLCALHRCCEFPRW